MILAAAALLLGSAAPVRLADLPDDAPIHLGITLALRDPAGMEALLAAQQDPRSASYHVWLDPQTFGARFGQSEADFAAVLDWFTARGFQVTPYPNRSFFEAVGRVDAVRSALGVQVHWAEADGKRFHAIDGEVKLPPSFAAKVVGIAGLDTHPRLRHRLNQHIFAAEFDGGVLGPADLRLEYDMVSLTSNGNAAAGLTTAVLATQEGTTTQRECNRGSPGGTPLILPSPAAIAAYFALGDATATYNPIVMTNTGNDFDTCGANVEYQLDVEMQSVGAPNATDIDLVLSPSSEVFQTGAQYIVNSVSNAVVVSTSLGLCEAEEASGSGGGPTTSGSEMQVMEQAVKQGIMEGQTWFAAAGDTGADDCNDNTSGTSNGFGGGNATVDFPGSMPEIMDMGGTQFSSTGSWDLGGDLVAYVPEVVWNEQESLPAMDQGGAGGGGQSLYYGKPSYQTGVGPEAGDGTRDVPDLSLEAASDTPGVAIYDCGSGQDSTCQGATTGSGPLDIYGGTSVASPLAAGIFALLSGQAGCPLGDVHAEVYALGAAQLNGGPQVFYDITSGNNTFVDPNVTITGYTAGPGYDLATGWGTIDVAALVSNWPSCSSTTTTTSSTTTTTTTTVSATASATASGTTGSATGTTTAAATGTSGSNVAATTTAASSSSGATTRGASSGTSSTSSSGGSSGKASTASSTGGASNTAAAASSTTGTATAGPISSGGCSCASASGETCLLWGPLAWVWLSARRRSERRRDAAKRA